MFVVTLVWNQRTELESSDLRVESSSKRIALASCRTALVSIDFCMVLACIFESTTALESIDLLGSLVFVIAVGSVGKTVVDYIDIQRKNHR